MTQRTAVVTGASSGFGRLTAQTLAADGWRVYATMRNVATTNAGAATALKNAGISVVELDVTSDASVDAAAKTILDGVAAGKARLMVGNDARVIDRLVRLLPALYPRAVARLTPSIGG